MSLGRWFESVSQDSYCCILTFDPAKHTIPKTAEVTHSDGSNGRKSCRQAWLTIWDKVKSRGTVTDWCPGREWPVNCMTVISARWQSNMPFQRQQKWHIPMASYGGILSERLNYYITRWRRKSVSLRSNELETRCGRENSTQRRGPPVPRLSSPGERERHTAMSGGVWEVNMSRFLFSLQFLLTHKPFK